MFAAFCLFWTASPMLLAGPEFHLSQSQIALFALVGITGAVFAPVVGKLADRGFTQRASFFSFAGGSISFLLSRVGEPGSALSLGCLTLAAVLLDAGVSGNLVLGQRAIFSLEPEFRGRLNSLYIAIIFIGGSLGSFLGAWAYARGQWPLTAWIGLALPTTGFLLFLTEWRRRPTLR
jgi:predicted MFS family arabinose efflux permease